MVAVDNTATGREGKQEVSGAELLILHDPWQGWSASPRHSMLGMIEVSITSQGAPFGGIRCCLLCAHIQDVQVSCRRLLFPLCRL